MYVQANTIEELIEKSNNVNLFKELYQILKEEIAQEGTLFKTDSNMTMIGFKYIKYQNTNYNGMWPLIAIAPQKNNISIYVLALENDEYIVQKYGKEFGKSNIGKSCIRIKKLDEKRIESLKVIIQKALQTN